MDKNALLIYACKNDLHAKSGLPFSTIRLGRQCDVRTIHLPAFLIGMLLLATGPLALRGASFDRQGLLGNDAIAFLREDIVWHVSFDSQNPRSDIGDLAVIKTKGDLAYAPGLVGQALVISGKPQAAVEYEPVQPIFQGAGAICFWVMPQSWIQKGFAESRGIIVLLHAMIGGGALIVERQGFAANPKRTDYLLVLLNKVTEGTPLAVADTTEAWENGVWHLVVINWNEKGLETSVDGKALKRTAYPRPLVTRDFAGHERFTLGCNAADAAEITLLDEITVFKRPLEQNEIRKVYKTGSAKIIAPVPPARETKNSAAAISPSAGPGASWNTEILRTEARLPFINSVEAPKIDGVIGEDEWGGALKEFGGYRNTVDLEQRECVYYLASDGDKIYVAVRSELPPTKTLLSFNQPQGDKDVAPLASLNDDSVEIWLMPDKRAGGKMFALLFNYPGAVYDFSYDPQSKRMDAAWRSKAEYAGKIVGNEWQAEISVPASSLGRAAVAENMSYGIHIVRNFKRPGLQANWTPLTGAFTNPENMGVVTWDNKAPLVRFVSALSADKQKIDLVFEAQNKGGVDIPMVIERYWQCAGNTDFTAKENVLLKAKGKRIFTLVKDTAVGGQYFVVFKALAPDGRVPYFSRKFIWQTRRGNNVWTVDGLSPDALFRYGYYPYFNKIRTKVDISGMENRGSVTGAVARLTTKSGEFVAEAVYPPLVNSVAEFTFDVPVLRAGEYAIEALLLNAKGSRVPAAKREFQRKIFEWEGNRLGISDEVIPPFTPIEVSGQKVMTVLRSHALNDIGFPEQIESDGRNILAGPISLRAEVDGKQETLHAGKPLAFTRMQKNEVGYKTSWNAGALNGSISASFDYDGMLKITMDLDLPGKAILNRCDLAIPIMPETAKFMHVLSDTGKASFTDKIPGGENPVWESLFIDHCQAADDDGVPWRLPGTFVPYVWVGDENRGIAWFAAGDKDWLVNDKQSAVTIDRYKDRTEIVVHFVTQPGTLDRKRSIVFALQATPTKPMPMTPAPWRNIVFSMPQLGGQYNAAIIGSALQWGGDDYYTFYPRGKDYTIFEIIRKTRAGEYNAEAWSRWAEGYDPNIPFVDRIRRNIRSGEGVFRSRPETVIPYTDMRGIVVREEDFRVFQDEWLVDAYSPKKWPEYDESGAFGYSAIACRSRQDYILWYFNKMLDSGAMDGIYYDVQYPQAIRNTVSGQAYIDDFGKIRAVCDIFDTRELFKRSAVLAWQKRRYNLNVAHMSFTLMAPVHSWAGAILDWESRYGMDDFQERFKREYIHAVSLGRQVGAMPIACGSIGITGVPDRRPWVNRTLAGTLITHEIKDWAVGWGKDGIYEKSLRLLYAFGYGADDCAVYNYWNKDFPAVIEGLDVAALVLVKNGEALIVVCDYGEGGTCRLALDPEKIKIESGGRFRDLENGLILERKGDLACSFEIKKHDFRIIAYNSGESKSSKRAVPTEDSALWPDDLRIQSQR